MNNMLKIIFYMLLNFIFLATVQAGDTDLKSVLGNLEKIKHINAEFEETKTISMLSNKIKLSGRLKYTSPDSIIKQTLLPAAELFAVKGNDLHIKNVAGEETDLLLTNYPVVEMFVEAYRGLLSGDLKKLKTYYSVKFNGDISHWEISLTPIEDEALELIEFISAEGTDASITKVTIHESNGDTSSMLIKNK